MKTILIALINFYQKIISPSLKQLLGFNNSCRFYPTCSEYTKNAISQKGFLVGLYAGFLRLLKCQPFYNPAKI
ncbi:MAG: membrane protein insertion efficiency factor YidD [Candidatus Levybacteria bacterium RIFCSPLOWO2_01_FULL_36_13]|nr:MAG: membrane protein insertion efficiency factor YidD [Candidatus Levybacteria bacterium RIFCSPHIGHO2_01_FULL_36_15b]OGH34232.1 MAG: membrane protein insertion efficiency factor YidD [Candidatus Levybacteria bacterium RIFCSPLOWO2_01_FULL_36_13]